jgi:hypothetical protein
VAGGVRLEPITFCVQASAHLENLTLGGAVGNQKTRKSTFGTLKLRTKIIKINLTTGSFTESIRPQ